MAGHEDPRTVRSRQRVLAAAQRVFLAEGFQGATLEAVALESGVVKRTLYNLYADKEELFRATILSAIEIADAFAGSLVSDLREPHRAADLVAIAERLAQDTLLGPALPLRRMLVMESRRFPDLVAEYRRRAPEAVMAALADLLQAMDGSGELDVPDSRLAAEHFAFLVMGADLDRGMFTGRAPAPATVRAFARAGAEAFTRAYRPRSSL